MYRYYGKLYIEERGMSLPWGLGVSMGDIENICRP